MSLCITVALGPLPALQVHCRPGTHLVRFSQCRSVASGESSERKAQLPALGKHPGEIVILGREDSLTQQSAIFVECGRKSSRAS